MKLNSAYKIKLSIMMYVSSPHTLHRMPITKNAISLKVDYKERR